ncbi:hypothetical protein REPUB_Repub11eG0040900 [Reevesia pubescens]
MFLGTPTISVVSSCHHQHLTSPGLLTWLSLIITLRILDLNSNKHDSPVDPIQGPNRIQYLDLSKNEIQGPIPSSFFKRLNLADLDLSSNYLSGNIKSSMLPKLRNLEQLDLSINGLLSLTVAMMSILPSQSCRLCISLLPTYNNSQIS